MSTPFDRSVKEDYDRLATQTVELSRHVRDLIGKSDDTKAVFKLVTRLLQAHESRVLLDSGEGKHPDGRRYTLEDYCENVGEVRGIRWLENAVNSMIRKADKADEEERKRVEAVDSKKGE